MDTEFFRLVLLIIGVIVLAMLAIDAYRRVKRNAADRRAREHVEAKESARNRNEGPLGEDFFDECDGILSAPKVRVERVEEPVDEDELESLSAVPREPELVITLYLMAKSGSFDGAKLLEALVSQGLRFGEMDIFHRHRQASGKGARIFSVANAVTPGIFDLDNMESFSTPGIVFFMTLPGPKQPKAGFELMLTIANRLKDILDGRLLDAQRTRLTEQMLRHYHDQIVEFERKTIAKDRGLVLP